MSITLVCDNCDAKVSFNMQRTNAKNALLAHYGSSHCKKRRYVDNSEKDNQTTTFIQHLEFTQSNDEDENETQSLYDDPCIAHALSFNDNNIIQNYDNNTIDLINIAASNGIDDSIVNDGFECNDEYLIFQSSILSKKLLITTC